MIPNILQCNTIVYDMLQNNAKQTDVVRYNIILQMKYDIITPPKRSTAILPTRSHEMGKHRPIDKNSNYPIISSRKGLLLYPPPLKRGKQEGSFDY